MRLAPLGQIIKIACLQATLAPAQLSAASSGTPPADYDLDDVYHLFESARVVTIASKERVSVDAAAAIVSVVSREEIEARGYRSVADALADVPGLYVVNELSTRNIGVRGINGGVSAWSRVIKVLVNGAPVTFEALGGSLMGLELIPIDIVATIEIVRGPASALYGANAFLGVVNITTIEPTAAAFVRAEGEGGWIRDRPAGGITASTHLRTEGAGGNGARWLQASVSLHRENRSGLETPSTGPRASDYVGVASRRDLSRPMSAFVRLGVDTARWGAWTLQAVYQRTDAFEEFGPLTRLTHGTRVAMGSARLRLAHKAALAGDRMESRSFVGLADGRDLPQQHFTWESRESRVVRKRTNQGVHAGSELLLHVDDHSLLFGFDHAAMRQSGDTLWREPIENDGSVLWRQLTHSGRTWDYANWGLYGQAVLALRERLNLTAGCRYDVSSRWRNSLSLRAGITWGILNNLSVKLLYGSSFVPPAPAQLESNPVTTSGAIVGNPELQPQHASTQELGLRYRPTSRFSLSVNAFVTRVKDRVEYERKRAHQIAKNLTETTSVGGEAGVELALAPFFVQGNVSTNDSRIEDLDPMPSWFRDIYRSDHADNHLLPGFPRWTGHINVGARLVAYHLQANLAAHVASARNSSAFNSPGDGAYRLRGYVTLDCLVRTVELRTDSGETVDVSLQVLNLLDRRYAEAGSRGIDIPGLGRQIYLRFRLQL